MDLCLKVVYKIVVRFFSFKNVIEKNEINLLLRV